MKQNSIWRPIAVFITLFAAIVLTVGVFVAFNKNIVEAQKNKSPQQVINLDDFTSPVAGRTVLYQLRDEEGGAGIVDVNGLPSRKVAAVVIRNLSPFERSGTGQLLFKVRVFRDDELGGDFTTLAPIDSGRNPGTIDFPKAGDLVY